MSFFNKGDMIYVGDKNNRYAKETLVCIEATSVTATFLPFNNLDYDIPIYLGQYQESLDNIEGLVITRTDNPEYFI